MADNTNNHEFSKQSDHSDQFDGIVCKQALQTQGRRVFFVTKEKPDFMIQKSGWQVKNEFDLFLYGCYCFWSFRSIDFTSKLVFFAG